MKKKVFYVVGALGIFTINGLFGAVRRKQGFYDGVKTIFKVEAKYFPEECESMIKKAKKIIKEMD